MFGKTKSPWSVLIAGADTVPLDSLISVTVAPGTTPPWTSLTMPDSVPVTPWAPAGAAPADQATTRPSATPRYRVRTLRFDMSCPRLDRKVVASGPRLEDWLVRDYRQVMSCCQYMCAMRNTAGSAIALLS